MIETRIRFRHLRTFIEVARQRSVVRAAEVLNVTQPAVTKAVRELEEILGQRLFAREGRGVKITRYGEIFLKYAGTSVAALQAGVDSLSSAATPTQLRVGALPTVASRVVPLALTKFLAEKTGSIVKIVTGETRPLVDRLKNGDLDIVVGRLSQPEQMTGLRFEYLYSEHIRFVVRSGHPLVQKRPFDFTLIRDFPILMPPASSVIRPYVDRFLLAHGMEKLPYALESVSASFGKAFTIESDAVWVISEGVVALDIEAGRFESLPVDTSETLGPVGLTTRDEDLNASAAMFCRIVHMVVEQLIRDGRIAMISRT